MNLDDPVCLCFHVTRRKVIRFIKIEKPRRASQLSECFGAGTGCGWCRPYLERLMKDNAEGAKSAENELDSMDLEQYQSARIAFREQKNRESGESEE